MKISRSAGAGAACLALLGVLAACQADEVTPPTSTCVAERLTVPSPPDEILARTEVTDMDPSGRFVVGAHEMRTDEARVWAAVRWDSGEPELLMASDADLRPSGVNEHGWMVGQGVWRVVDGIPVTELHEFAWVFTGDGFPAEPLPVAELPVVILPIPEDAGGSRANAITERGEIAGVVRLPLASAAAVWSPDIAGGYSVRVLASRGQAGASDITEDATVVGVAADRPYVWGPDGKGRALPLPADVERGYVMRASGDRAYGMGVLPAEGRGTLLAWDLRTDEFVTVAAGSPPPFGSGNARGDVAYGGDDAVVLQRGDRIDTLLPPEGTQWLINPIAVSEDGTVVAGFTGTNGVLWRC